MIDFPTCKIGDMAKEYRYSLETRGKLHVCVSCGKKRMTRYIDKETNEYLPEKYGRCARLNNCAYHLNPYHDSYGKEVSLEVEKKKKAFVFLSYIPLEVLKHTFKGYDSNEFIKRLAYPKEDVRQVINMYRLGSISGGEFQGAITFPFIDEKLGVRAIQVKHFKEDFKIEKESPLSLLHEKYYLDKKLSVPQWIRDYKRNEVFESCLFGEHLLKKYPNNPVALVQNPESAVYGTFYFGIPKTDKHLIFLSEGNLSILNYKKCSVLVGRTVVLYPDLSTDSKSFEVWKRRALEFEKNIPHTKFVVSEFLEEKALEQDRIDAGTLLDFISK